MRLLPILVLSLLGPVGLSGCDGARSASPTSAASPLPDLAYTLRDCDAMLAGPSLRGLGWSGTPTTASGGFGCAVTTGRGTLTILRTAVAGANGAEVASAAPGVFTQRCAELGARRRPATPLVRVDWLGAGRSACADAAASALVALTPSSKVVLIRIAPTADLAAGEARQVLTAAAAAAQ